MERRRWAKSVGASVTVVTVTELWSALEMAQCAEAHGAKAIEEYETMAADYAGKILGAATKEAKAAGVACETRHVSDRHPSDGILEAAKDAERDLIVMSSHGRRGLNRHLLRSQATAVFTYSKIPVLVVR